MTNNIQAIWEDRKSWIRKAWFVLAGIAAVYYGVLWPSQAFRGIAESKATALAAFENQRHEHWFQPAPSPAMESYSGEGVVGGVPGGLPMMQKGVVTRLEGDDAQRKIVRTTSLSLIVEKPAEAASRIQELAEHAGGFLVSWDANGAREATSASLSIRVPVPKYQAVRLSILTLAQRVENEHVQAEDVTKQYVDDAARLRNLRAQEGQYLSILKITRTAKDTLDVSEKLNQVRGEIEQQQSEFNVLSKQVDLVAVSLSLRKETEAQVFGLPWRPGYELKFAARQGLEGLIDYSTSIMAFIFYLPAIALWMTTILLGTWVAWNVLRGTTKKLFVGSRSSANS